MLTELVILAVIFYLLAVQAAKPSGPGTTGATPLGAGAPHREAASPGHAHKRRKPRPRPGRHRGPDLRKGGTPLRWIMRHSTPANRCLADIIDLEDGRWDPRVGYGGAHRYPDANGRIGVSFGLPQALPGDKMKSAGADWYWNALTQLRWARTYARARYRSECAARAYRVTHHSW